MKERRGARGVVSCLAIAGLAVMGQGCNPTSCDQKPTITEITDGITHAEERSYVSAPWAKLDRFGAGEALDFIHGLGVVPQTLQSFVAFDESSSAAENAGNQGIIECADAERIRLRNDTCESFYVRVVVQAFGDGDILEKPCD
jgi:hypothetical protein